MAVVVEVEMTAFAFAFSPPFFEERSIFDASNYTASSSAGRSVAGSDSLGNLASGVGRN